jgi:hypothetical protein
VERFAVWDGYKLVDPDGLLADATAIWEWGVAERVSTGLIATRIGLEPVGAQMLAAADHIAALKPKPRPGGCGDAGGTVR